MFSLFYFLNLKENIIAIQHKDITGANVHEPKGIETAANGLVYVANGAGSGTWRRITTQGIDGFPSGTPAANQVLTTNGSGGITVGSTAQYGSLTISGTTAIPINTTDTVITGSTVLNPSSGLTRVNSGLRVTIPGVYKATVVINGTLRKGFAGLDPSSVDIRFRINGSAVQGQVARWFSSNNYDPNEGTTSAATSQGILTQYISLTANQYVEPVFRALAAGTSVRSYVLNLDMQLVR